MAARVAEPSVRMMVSEYAPSASTTDLTSPRETVQIRPQLTICMTFSPRAMRFDPSL